jgi:hypothetical protein
MPCPSSQPSWQRAACRQARHLSPPLGTPISRLAPFKAPPKHSARRPIPKSRRVHDCLSTAGVPPAFLNVILAHRLTRTGASHALHQPRAHATKSCHPEGIRPGCMKPACRQAGISAYGSASPLPFAPRFPPCQFLLIFAPLSLVGRIPFLRAQIPIPNRPKKC